MKKINIYARNFIFITVMILQLIGCARNYNNGLTHEAKKILTINYKTDLRGAKLCKGNQCLEHPTPVSLTYKLTPEDIASGKKTIDKVTIRWVSGATLNIKPKVIDLSKGLDQELFYSRPTAASNIKDDISMAQLEETKEMNHNAAVQALFRQIENASIQSKLAKIEQNQRDEDFRRTLEQIEKRR